MNHANSQHDNKKAVSQFSAPQVLLVSSKNHEVLAKSKALPPWLILQLDCLCFGSSKLLKWAVSVDLRVSRIYRHLAASPLFEGQIAGAGGTPRLSYLPFQTMEMPLDGDNTKDS